MTLIQHVEIKGCNEELRFLGVCVDLSERKKIGKDMYGEKPSCNPVGTDTKYVELIVTRGKNYSPKECNGNIAQITLECPETRCIHHRRYQATPQS